MSGFLYEVGEKVIVPEGALDPLRCPECRHILYRDKHKTNKKTRFRCFHCHFSGPIGEFEIRYAEISRARVLVPLG